MAVASGESDVGAAVADTPVRIFDTTLRDGEQSPGISLNLREKVEIAEQLARLGVDVIEAGFPIASQGETEAVQAIAKVVTGPVVAGLARCDPRDIDRAAEALAVASRPRIHTFIATSEIHMKAKLKLTPVQVLTAVKESCERARRHVDDVEFSCEDATRSDPEFLVQVFGVAASAGATTLNLPDTVGYALPEEFAALLSYLRSEVGRDVTWSVHTHDDLGLAVANALAGISAGARQVEVAVNGIGERAGNCSLEEIVMTLRTRRSASRSDTAIATKEIARTSRLVSMLTGYPVPPNKAIVGANAFAHEAGIHQHGVMMDRTTYEIMDPVDVGLEGTRIVLGKHSGRHAFVQALEDLGLSLDKEEMARAFARFKAMADRKIRITDVDLEAIVVDELASDEDAFELVSIQVAGGTHLSPTATVRLRRGDEVIDESAIGDGMIDAACGAIARAAGIDARLESFTVSSVTGGIDALGDVTIVLATQGGERERPERRATGRGVSTDVVEASARAYLSAANRLLRITSSTGSAPPSAPPPPAASSPSSP
ncbi:MAG: 2-isopropylmalate synthase [Actinomycetota bacterium]|nr:2-isopropylmalate synthase [Actinomycetota bacterium]